MTTLKALKALPTPPAGVLEISYLLSDPAAELPVKIEKAFKLLD
jgi:hypothetical protein